MRTRRGSSGRSWHVVETHVSCEQKVARGLMEQRIEVVLPLLWKRVTSRHGQILLREVPLLGRYLFFSLDDPFEWVSVKNTRGVLRVLANGGRASTIDDQYVDKIRSDMESGNGAVHIEEPRAQVAHLVRGEKVRISDGPMAGLNGIYDGGNLDRVRVMMKYLGAERIVDMPRQVVQKL